MASNPPASRPWRSVLSSFAEPYGTEPATRRSSLRSWLAVVVLLVIVTLGARWFASAGATKNTRAGRPPAAVATAPVVLADVPEAVSAIGTVTPLDTATVHTQLSGNVTAILFKEGQMVSAGQPIVEIDTRPFKLALQQAEGNLARDSAQLAAAELDLKRYETLASQDSVARQTLEDSRGTVGQLRGTVAADRASAGTARLNLQYSTIKAPFAGRIGLRQVSVGSFVSPGDANGVAVVTRIDPIDVTFSVPQALLGDIQRKVGSGAGLPVTILDQDNHTKLAEGQFSTFDNQINTSTGTVQAKARVANPPIAGKGSAALFPNQFVNVSMLIDTLRQVPVVPVSALRHGPQGDFVFVVKPDHTVRIAVVRLGPSDGQRTAVLGGVNKGDIVVSEGADGLDDGSAVRLPGEKGGKDGGAPGAGGGASGKSGNGSGKHRAGGGAASQ